MESYVTKGRFIANRKFISLIAIFIWDQKKLYNEIKSIINNVLIWSSNITSILVYFEYIYRVFQKYRVSSRQHKFHFLLDQVEYAGHAL